MAIIERNLVSQLLEYLKKDPPFLQTVIGPRQVGKTVAVKQVINKWKGPTHYATADLPRVPDAYWIEAQWQVAKKLAEKGPCLLVLDEVQKIPRWSEVMKALYDENSNLSNPIRCVLLGSAALQVQKGSQESLAGRFERHFCPHWSWSECREAFNWDLDTWLYYGGYPGAAALHESPERWANYISDSLIDSVLSKDVLQLTTISKPALLRQLFMLAAQLPAQIVSYNKMLGQLQDAGNTVTLAHYLELLSSAYLISGLQKWTAGHGKSKASSPKLIVWNNALVTALSSLPFHVVRTRTDLWGRLVENAVGATILNQLPSPLSQLYYWREKNEEVDFVLEHKGQLIFIEVKSGKKSAEKSLGKLKREYPHAKTLVVGAGGIPLETFFAEPFLAWL